jgi:Carboxypeptidase regulatory-like domain
MRRLVLLVGLVAGLAALAAWVQRVEAQTVERIRITDPARQAHGLPAGLTVELSSPPDYNRQSTSGDAGRWTGPRYEERGNPGNAGFASLDWAVSFEERTGEADAAALAHIDHGNWQRDQRGGLSVSHVVGSAAVGTVLGYYYLMSPSVGAGDARFEAALAFPLDVDLYAIVHIELLEPPNDSFVVNGSTASNWNRGQALLTLAGVRLQGNLPPKIVAAHAYEHGRFVRGKVVDRFLDAVVGARVALERQSGGSWTKVAGGKTSPRGFYSLRARARGRYRVTVRMADFTAQSRELRAGRR